MAKGHQPAAAAADGQANAMAHRLANVFNNDVFLGDDKFYFAELQGLNGSGVSGTALLSYDTETQSLTVAVMAKGLEANQVHIQHIHGFADGTDATIPTLQQDADGDGYIELGEAAPTYGPILLNLSVDHASGAGGDNGHSHDGALTGFPTAPDGTIEYLQTFHLPSGDLSADPSLTLDHIVIHGMSVPAGAGAGTGGEVDGTSGYKLVLPVAIGEIEAIQSMKDLSGYLHDYGMGF